MILAAGLSPAWQQILTFESFSVGEVNRASASHWCASGKVLNVGRACWSLGAEGRTLSIIGGQSGDAIRAEFQTDGIPATWIETATATRVCTTIVDRSAPDAPCITELVENAAPVTEEELREFEEAYVRLAEECDHVVLTGSLSEVIGQGRPIDLYSGLLKQSPPAILDMREAELKATFSLRPLLVKPNRDELSATVGRPLGDEPAVVSAMQELIEAGAQWVLITDGANPALLAGDTGLWRVTPPQVQVVNPIGCGDCLAAGIAVALEGRDDMVAAVRFGMAAAVENSRNLLPARLSPEAIQQTLETISVVPISR